MHRSTRVILCLSVLVGCSSAANDPPETRTTADGSNELNSIGALESLQCLGLGRVDLWPDTTVNIQPTQARLPDPSVPQVTGKLLSEDLITGQTWSNFVGEFDAPPSAFFTAQDTFVLSPDHSHYRLARAPRNGQAVPDVVNKCQPAASFDRPQQAHESTAATQAEWDAMPVVANPANSSDWILTFHDEFDSSTLSPQWNTHYFGSTAFTSLDNGILHLSVDANRPDFAFQNIRVSSITTQDSFSQKYGWFEIRARMPEGSGLDGTGLAASFWTLPVDTRYNDLSFTGGTRNNGWESYEIDIFEDNSHTSHAGANGGDLSHLSQGRFFDYPFVRSRDFHVYAMEWSPTLVTWYVDGKVVFKSTLVPQSPMWFLIQMRSGHGATPPPEQFANGPKSMDIDYFRAYKRSR